MSDQPTLDGLTADQMLTICEKAALRDAKEQIAAAAHTMARPINAAETACLGLGITAGVHAAIAEFAKRGLIVDRP